MSLALARKGELARPPVIHSVKSRDRDIKPFFAPSHIKGLGKGRFGWLSKTFQISLPFHLLLVLRKGILADLRKVFQEYLRVAKKTALVNGRDERRVCAAIDKCRLFLLMNRQGSQAQMRLTASFNYDFYFYTLVWIFKNVHKRFSNEIVRCIAFSTEICYNINNPTLCN